MFNLSSLFSDKATGNQKIGAGFYGFLALMFGGVAATNTHKPSSPALKL